MLNIFSSMRRSITEKVSNKEPGLYISLIFPIAFAFLLTFSVARLISYLWPWLYLTAGLGIHVHHFAYGFFVLAASGYLALIYTGARAKFLISLLHGFGLGMALDEFAIWLKLSDSDPSRWSYDGLLIFIGLCLLLLSAKKGIKLIKFLWPFKTIKGDNIAQNEPIF